MILPAEEELDVIYAECEGVGAIGAKEPAGERLLAVLEFQHLALDRVLSDQLVHEDRLLQADPIPIVVSVGNDPVA